MKNLLLTVVLASLVTFAYFHEEIGKAKKEATKIESQKIISFMFDEVDRIELPNTNLVKNNGVWIVKEMNFLASNQNVNKLLKIIESIHQLDLVKLNGKSEKEFFKYQDYEFTISSKENTWKYRLGDVSELTGNFYVQDLNAKDRPIYIAKDTSLFEGMYKNELELYLNQYIRLKNYISAAPKVYMEPRVFYDVLQNGISRIKINNRWNRWFEVDVTANKTIPEIKSALKYLNLKSEVTSKMNLIHFKELHKDSVLSEKVSDIEITSEGKKIVASLYVSLDGRAGNFLQIKGNKWIYELKEGAEKLFFQNVQQFWDKKIHYQKDLSKLKRIDFELSVADIFYKFYIDDIEKFEFKWDDAKVKSVNVQNLNFLFHILFGLENFNQALIVKDLEKNDKEIFAMKVKLLNKELTLRFYLKDIILENHSDNYQMHYDYSFSGLMLNSINDFFALK